MKLHPLILVWLLAPSLFASGSHSIARTWNEEILAAIRIDLPHPPVHARNLFHLSVAMYDAWAAYDPVASGVLYHGKPLATDPVAARREAISYAAYRMLSERYALSRNAPTTLAALDARFQALGYDKNNRTTDPATPAGIGNRVAALVSAYFMEDGAFQADAYRDRPPAEGGYAPLNPPLLTLASGTLAISVDRWQPLAITNAISQNNIPVEIVQKFLGSQWLGVRPFSLSRPDPNLPWINPGPQPRLDGPTGDAFRAEVVEVIRLGSQLTPEDGAEIDISPGAFGNNTLGENDGVGHRFNPVTTLPYAPNVVLRGDFGRVLAEFWADGPNSETPPGHWNTLANGVSDHPLFVKRLGGTGPVLDDLEWDVKLYLTLNGALHDAACAAWSLKRFYDGGRPIQYIRFMGQRGQSSNPADAQSYDPRGLPLVPGLIEVVTFATSRVGGRHVGLQPGRVAVLAWPGQPNDPTNQIGGQRWILAADWVPYQKKNFVTPAFPGYVSGHSTFSRAAAEALAAITGSPFFPGGLGTFTAPANGYLTFEKGPSRQVQLQWATYYDAADQAGLSRLWGGIHVPVDDLMGRRIGAVCGLSAWTLARTYFDGSVLQSPPLLTFRRLPSGDCELVCETTRGLTYEIQFTGDLAQPFRPLGGTPFQATDTSVVRLEATAGAHGFFRLLRYGTQ